MKILKISLLATVAVALVVIGSCAKQKGPAPSTVVVTCDSTKVSYVLNVKPIVSNQCATAGCHDASTVESGVDLSSYSGSRTAVENQNAVCYMQGSTCSQMPPGYKLSDSLINVIVKWKSDGYCN